MDGQDGGSAIVFPAEHLLDLGSFHFTPERIEPERELAGDLLTLACPFDEHRQVVAAAGKRRQEVGILFESAAALQNLLRLGLILPEIRLGDPGFQSFQFISGPGDLKDSSEGQRSVSADPDTGA